LLRNPKKGSQGPTWTAEPYDVDDYDYDDDDDDDNMSQTHYFCVSSFLIVVTV
jgi:hypothetical protein